MGKRIITRRRGSGSPIYRSPSHRHLTPAILPKLKSIRENRIPYVFHSDHSIPRTVTLGTYTSALDIFWKGCRY